MVPKYTFLFAPIDGVGHVNACLGIAEQLRDRGHDVVFALPTTWKGKLVSKGFREELFEISHVATTVKNGGDQWGDKLLACKNVLLMSPLEVHDNFQLDLYKTVIQQVKYTDARLRQIVSEVKPHVIVVDNSLRIPALMDQGIPWVLSVSISPIGISSVNVPPAFSGYPTSTTDRREWIQLEEKFSQLYAEISQDFGKWVVEHGGPPLTMNYPFFLEFSPFANIYMYPRELDYKSLRPNPPNFHQFDAFVRQSEDYFEIPQKLVVGNGKLIYFSLGTIGSVELDLMRRLLAILSKSPNRFIVSKGPRGDELELADNMWGANYLPQTKVMEVVDLVITHGGNNTLTEAFYFGKRVLVLPLLWDQLDNGQRILETGHGLSFHPCKVKEDQLLSAIETLLADKLLERRMLSISHRIHAANNQARAADLLESIALNNKLSIKIK